MLSPYDLDCALYSRRRRGEDGQGWSFAPSPYGEIRVYDTGGPKPALLMVPDGPCFIEHFDALIEAARKDWRVIVFDMPGFGRSFPKSGYRHSFEQACEVIECVFDALDPGPATLAFSCANGYYALCFSRKRPDLVRRIVLMQTPGLEAMRAWKKQNVPWPVRIPYIGQLAVYFQRLKIPHIWFKASLPKDSEKRAGYTETSCREIRDGACNCLASVSQGLESSKEADLVDAPVPVHLIWGARDFSHRHTDPATVSTMARQATVEIWDDAGHFPNLEFPERFLESLKQAGPQ